MKRIFLFINLIGSLIVQSQTTEHNFVKTVTYTAPTTTSLLQATSVDPQNAMVQINYFDGLGRPIQQVMHKQASNGNDVIQTVEYDALGRQAKEYLPFVRQSATMVFEPNALSGVHGFYQADYSVTLNPQFENTEFPFSEKLFEASPLNRVRKQTAPGLSWRMGSGNEIKFEYSASRTTDQVKKFKASTSSSIFNPTLQQTLGNYGNGELYKTITKDENWKPNSGKNHTTEEFKNQLGQVLLKRTYNEGVAHDTYYVYDEYGNLTFVIPPKVVVTANITEEILNELCYRYIYDERNRLVEKKIPGKRWEFIIYDKLDRPIATGPVKSPFSDHDENKLGWNITCYDVFNRPVIQGWKSAAFLVNSRIVLQNIVNAIPNTQINMTRTSSLVDILGSTLHYQNNSQWPGTNYFVLSVNYYDNYNQLAINNMPTAIMGEPVIQQVKTLPTWQTVRVLQASNNNNFQRSYTLYDKKYRPIYSYLLEPDGGYTAVESKLDFTGKVLQTRTKHKLFNSSQELTTEEFFEYTPQGLLVSHHHKINGAQTQRLSEPTYDALGQMIRKKVGGLANQSSLQEIDYQYNIRGWLRQINNIDNLEDDLFAFKINYETPTFDSSTALFNGNISETFWRSTTDNIKRHYSYEYDNLNRLKEAIYGRNMNITNNYNESLWYDKNGNIEKLTRFGQNDFGMPIPLDDLIYQYKNNNQSNILTRVTETNLGNPAAGYIDGTNTNNDYEYDAFGNMLLDRNKGITSIEYNHLNLPRRINFATGGNIIYIYNAQGVKLQKTVSYPNQTQATTRYRGGFQYDNQTLQFVHTAEGYAKHTPNPSNASAYGAFDYVYNYTDHLGNIRLSYVLDPAGEGLKVMEENHYYPFGLKHSYNLNKRDIGYFDHLLAVALDPTEDTRRTRMVNNNGYQYKYNGKEFQDELGLNVYDYGYRGYDPAIGRWSATDPLAEKYITTSPYAFVQNSPLVNREIDGRYFEEGSKSERQAARIERRAEKRADKLDKKADRLDAKGKSTGDLRDRASELRQTGQDVRDMRNDQSTEYKYAKVNSKMSGPATVGTGTNSKGDQVVTMFTEKNIGNQIHETRHGGQHFRGEVNAVTQESSIAVEVSAYRAQYSWNGSLKANTLDSSTISNIVDFQTNIHNQTLMSANQMPFGVQQTNISNISQINSGFVSNIVEIGQGGGRAPLPIVQNYLLWIYAGLK